MKIWLIFGFVALFVISPLTAETVMADVTGDGIEDEIKIGEQSVVVIDGASGKRFTVISGEELLVNAEIGNYHSGISGKEIAVIYAFSARRPIVDHTVIYGFKNNQFLAVSEELPGEVTINEDGDLVGYHLHYTDWQHEVYVPCPIIEENGLLKALTIKKETEKTIDIEAGKTKEITIDLSKNTLFVCFASVKEKDVIISLKDDDGTPIAEEKIDPESPFFNTFRTDKDEAITLTIDNSYSVMTPKTVFYVITQYNYTPSKKEIEAEIKSNMHTVQVCVEDYCIQHDGVYPRTVSEFKEIIPSVLVNPVNSNIPVVVDGKIGKPGQVTYSYDPETDTYFIYGFDADGKKLDLILSNK